MDKKQREELENLTENNLEGNSFSGVFSLVSGLFPHVAKSELAIWSAIYSKIETDAGKELFAATAWAMEASEEEKQAVISALDNPDAAPENIRRIAEIVRAALDMNGSGKLREYLGKPLQDIFDFIKDDPTLAERATIELSKISQIAHTLEDTTDGEERNPVHIGKGLIVPVQITFPQSAEPALKRLSEWDL